MRGLMDIDGKTIIVMRKQMVCIGPYATFSTAHPCACELSSCKSADRAIDTIPAPAVHNWFVAFFGHGKCGSRPRPWEDGIFVSFFVFDVVVEDVSLSLFGSFIAYLYQP